MADETIHPIRGLLRLPKVRGPRPIADLMHESPLRVGTASITEHVAVISLRDPLPSVGPVVRRALLKEARRLVRERAEAGPVTRLEVWAPLTRGGRLALVQRTRFEEPLGVPVSALAYGRGLRGYMIRGGPTRSLAVAAAGTFGVVDATSGTRIAGSIHLPAPVRKGLRELGVDEAASLPVFVEALMSEAGFSVRRHADKDGVVDLEAEINAATVLVRCYPSPGERVPMYAVDRFGCTFEDGDYDEGVFVSDGPLPAGVRRWQRDPRIHLVGRVRLQHFVDAVAARLIRTSIEGAISADPQR